MSLPRTLTLFRAVMLVVGTVVGAGIFTTSGFLALQVEHPAVFVGVWVLGGLLTLTGALTYAELGSMFPRAGGDYQFIKEAYGPAAGFALGWLSFLIIFPGSIAALSIALVEYIPGIDARGRGLSPYLAVLVIVFLSALNWRSTRLSSSTQAAVTVGSLVLLVGLAVGGALFGEGSLEHFTGGTSLLETGIPGSAMIAVFFTYSGWFAAAYVGSEVKRPERNVPLSLWLGTLIVTVLYTAVNAVYLYAMPLSEMGGAGGGINVAEMAARRLFGPSAAVFFSVAIALAIGGCISATVMTGARICFAMAEDQLMWSALSRVHPRHKTPHVALLAQAVIACFLVAIGKFDELLACVVFAMMLSCIGAGVGHIRLRIKRPEAHRSYKTPWFPVIPVVFVGAYAWFAARIAMENPVTSAVGIGLALTGLPFYYLNKKR